MEWSIFKHENTFVMITKEKVGDIPYLRFNPKDYTGVLPTVIYYHGSHSNKDFIRFQAMSIASFGYQVIVPDALYHGERGSTEYNNTDFLEKYVWEIILKSIQESHVLIKKLIEKHDADLTRICVLGDSMGAITAGGVFVKHDHLKCLAGFNGAFAWKECIKNNILPSSEPYIDEIELYDPITNEEKIKGRAISIFHGVEDTTIPIEIQKKFVDRMKPLYINNQEKLQLIEFSNINHRVTTSMLENLITWLKANL
ncbi:dienelactone hydrolase family protein [Clostridium sp. D2Q-11]|uniref:Dienelactone hydrolase family protein n=1 Tax=Anaeromonas frigoriresistens TaxID=2683708 RepID=A0A942UTR4_9FIRM|nr:dienelactone hydrolase family protein [Anaeromonas frigoriresistens]MBS4537280.1 dienelactone hydrolase family protein [Anaeromonas frigoriresistens]